jgi:predicted nucleotidyltransferase
MPESPDFEGVLRSLVESNVRFVLVGGLAMIAQGAANLTSDIDCLYARNPENIERLVEALRAIHPKLRTPKEAVPIVWTPDFFKNVLNVTLSTDMGSVDLLAEAPGVESFEEVWTRAQEMRLFDLPVRVASLDDLLRMKLATGRPKDAEHAMQLQALKKLLNEGSLE